jgi:hypothetical protein
LKLPRCNLQLHNSSQLQTKALSGDILSNCWGSMNAELTGVRIAHRIGIQPLFVCIIKTKLNSVA